MVFKKERKKKARFDATDVHICAMRGQKLFFTHICAVQLLFNRHECKCKQNI